LHAAGNLTGHSEFDEIGNSLWLGLSPTGRELEELPGPDGAAADAAPSAPDDSGYGPSGRDRRRRRPLHWLRRISHFAPGRIISNLALLELLRSSVSWLVTPVARASRNLSLVSEGCAAAAAALGPGLYGDSRFYPSREKFYLLKTCNTWTARLLQAAGYPVGPASALTVGTFMKQLRPYATLIQAPER
jgi:hypothetical protein